MTLLVTLACNDSCGSFERCIRAIEFEDMLRLVAVALDRPPRMSYVEFDRVTRIVRISGRAFPVTAYGHCMPGLPFDHVRMEAAVAAELLNFLKTRGAFEAESGYSDTFEAWTAEGIQFDAQCIERYLSETKSPGNVSQTKAARNVSGDSSPMDRQKVAQNDLGRVSAAQEAE